MCRLIYHRFPSLDMVVFFAWGGGREGLFTRLGGGFLGVEVSALDRSRFDVRSNVLCPAISRQRRGEGFLVPLFEEVCQEVREETVSR